jgi:hypothetical protein
MMVVDGGRERTEGEYGALVGAAGLRHARTIRIRGEVAGLDAAPGGLPSNGPLAERRQRGAR